MGVKVKFSFRNEKNEFKEVWFYLDKKSYEMSLELSETERYNFLLNEYKEYCKEQHYKRRVFVIEDLSFKDKCETCIQNSVVIETVFQQAISVLNDDEKDLIIKHYFEGVSKVEIAKQCQVTEGAVRKRINRCLVKMKKAIKDVVFEELSIL